MTAPALYIKFFVLRKETALATGKHEGTQVETDGQGLTALLLAYQERTGMSWRQITFSINETLTARLGYRGGISANSVGCYANGLQPHPLIEKPLIDALYILYEEDMDVDHEAEDALDGDRMS